MKSLDITSINKIGKVSKIIAKIFLVFTIIAAVASTALSIACFCVPADIATVNLNGTAEITVSQKYLEIGKQIISEVNTGMTKEGQTLEIAGTDYELVSASIDGDTIGINYKSLNDKLGVRNFGVLIASTALSALNTMMLLIFVVALCKAIENSQNPFEESIIDKMKKLAIALVPWVIINGVVNGIASAAITGSFDMSNGNLPSTLLIVFVFIVLISVFRYGAVLQQQSDETL